MRNIEVHHNKTLRLDNVLIKEFFSAFENSDVEMIDLDDNLFEAIVPQMENQIKSKGADTIGPLIQYSGMKVDKEDIKFIMSFMLQSSNFINNVDPGYEMESVIKVENCMYARFVGKEEDLQIAYKKIEVEAYENEIALNGSSYTIFIDSNDEFGEITADIFMEKVNG